MRPERRFEFETPVFFCCRRSILHSTAAEVARAPFKIYPRPQSPWWISPATGFRGWTSHSSTWTQIRAIARASSTKPTRPACSLHGMFLQFCLFVCWNSGSYFFSHGFYFCRDQENYQIVHLGKFHIYELSFWDSQKCFMSDNTKICKPISFRPCNCTDPNLGNSPTSSQRLILTAIQQSQCLSPQRIMGLRTDICSGRNPLSPDQVILAKLPWWSNFLAEVNFILHKIFTPSQFWQLWK